MPPAHEVHAPAAATLLLLVPMAAYLAAARARRRWPVRRAVAFACGLVLMAVAVSPAVAGHDPRGHMVQHLLLGMFAPLALVLAAPDRLLLGALPLSLRGCVRRLLRSRVLHVLTHPATAAVLDVGALYLLHLTALYAVTIHHGVAHHLVNLHFLLAGCLFTWSIVAIGPHRPTVTVRAVVLVVAGAAHAYLAKLLYARAPELPPSSGYDADQLRDAAQLMYYGGDLAELLLAVALFAGWYRAGRRTAHRAASVARPG